MKTKHNIVFSFGFLVLKIIFKFTLACSAPISLMIGLRCRHPIISCAVSMIPPNVEYAGMCGDDSAKRVAIKFVRDREEAKREVAILWRLKRCRHVVRLLDVLKSGIGSYFARALVFPLCADAMACSSASTIDTFWRKS